MLGQPSRAPCRTLRVGALRSEPRTVRTLLAGKILIFSPGLSVGEFWTTVCQVLFTYLLMVGLYFRLRDSDLKLSVLVYYYQGLLTTAMKRTVACDLTANVGG
ncbi:hypothetical protein EVAR_93892_1 [Eumeta japonica]|uniref:Uncharacterized protein n=1 Tax=Eumeta variegata TaxID=151549 RepID=A0A4C1TWU6_EUMVA|nr:hypothetical protein EVAR_93892_1 [Eumeta japonica]